MLSPYRIEWRKLSNVDFDCIVGASFDSDNGEMTSFLGKEAVASESYNGSYKRVHTYKWNEVLTPRFTFIKKDYEDFTEEENRKILAWLTGSNVASFLTVYHDDSNVISYELLGNFTLVDQYKLTNGRVIGYVCTFENSSPWAFSPIRTRTETITEPTAFEIICRTDDYESPVYPKITIRESDVTVVVDIDPELGSVIFTNDNYLDGTVYYDGTNYYWKENGVEMTSVTKPTTISTTSVRIINETVQNETYVTGNAPGEVIILDGSNRVISNGHNRIFGDSFSWDWFPLVNGSNMIKVIGNCTVTFEYREPIKCGEL